jgi:hypothetical protein
MKALRTVLAAILVTAALSAKATDKTDLWWNPAESGWGMTIAHQGSTIFITMYVYGTDNQPTWYVGTLLFQSTDSQGVNSWAGTWYRVTGPYYGVTFNPAAVNATQVGNVSYRELTVSTGQVTYNVGTTTVTKNVQRQTLQSNPSVNGNYAGAYFSTTSGCGTSSLNGTTSSFITMAVSGSPASTTLSILFGTTGTTCTVAAPYTQSGRIGLITSPWSCSNGLSGNTSIFEIEANENTISARFNATYNGCTEVGYFAAARFLP